MNLLEARPASRSDLPEQPRSAPRIARRFGWSCAVATALSALVFVWLLTDQSFDLFRILPFSNFYDIQARALLHGHWNVPPGPLWIEGFRIGGRTYMYYGPVPALLRIPVLLFTHRLDGKLTELSMLIAFIVALVAVSRLSWKVRLILRGSGEVKWPEALMAGAWTAAIGLGSVLVFLGGDLRVYYEAELWGASLSLCAFDAIVALAMRPSRWRVVAAGAFTTLAMMTRGSVGAGPLAALALVAVVHGVVAFAGRVGGPTQGRWLRWSHHLVEPRSAERVDSLDGGGRWQWLRGMPERTQFPSLVAAVLVPAAIYVVINEIKFRTLFSIPFTHQAYEAHNPSRQAVLAANHGSLFGLEYIPTSLLAYLRPDALRFTRLFPFVAFPGPATVIGHAAYDTRDFSSSVTATMPLLFVAALIGLFALFRPTGGWFHRTTADRVGAASTVSTSGLGGLRVAVAGAAIGTIGVLTIAYIANRYLADVVPLVVLLCLVGFYIAVGWVQSRRRASVRSAIWTVAVALAIFGVWVNLGLALVYQHELEPNIPTSTRAQFVSLQARVDTALFGSDPPPVARVSSLPRVAPVGSLAVMGECAGLYQFDGSQWFAVELGAKSGGIALSMTFPSGAPLSRQPVLQVGGRHDGEVLAVQQLSAHTVRFSYRSLLPGQPWWNGTSFSVVAGKTYQVTASFAARLGQVNAAIDGATRLNLVSTAGFLEYPVLAPGSVQLGTAPAIGGTSTHFEGRIHRISVTTPICNELLRRPG